MWPLLPSTTSAENFACAETGDFLTCLEYFLDGGIFFLTLRMCFVLRWVCFASASCDVRNEIGDAGNKVSATSKIICRFKCMLSLRPFGVFTKQYLLLKNSLYTNYECEGKHKFHRRVKKIKMRCCSLQNLVMLHCNGL